MKTPSAETKARVLAGAREHPSPTRSRAVTSAWLVLPASVLVAAALFFAFDGVEHGRGRPPSFYVACVVAWLLVAALSLWGALGHARHASWRSRRALVAVALGTPAALVAITGAFAVAFPEDMRLNADRLGVWCFGLTLAAAAFPLLALLRVRRESDPVHPLATGAALGSACGTSAGVMVVLWCPVAAPAHVLVGHVLPILVLAALGAAAGARTVGMRRP